jgi:hypothetical protein
VASASFDHTARLLLVEARGRRDGDLLLLAAGRVLGRHVEDAVGVDVERHLDLRHARGRRRDAVEWKRPERPVVLRQRPLALEDVDLHRGLVVAAVLKISLFWSGWSCCAGSAVA